MCDDIILKLRMLRLYFPSFREWYRDVWKQDANARECCNGDMCGCYGETHYDHWCHVLGISKFK